MKNVAFVIYRAWAYEIFKAIVSYQRKEGGFSLPVVITTPQAEFDVKEAEAFAKIAVIDPNDQEAMASVLKENEIDTAFYYGWSWMVREPILSNHICLCLHPSPLPRYRGGSPIQHQIIRGEKRSAVTVFRMGEGIDDGDIYGQIPISLEGSLQDIFSRMAEEGIAITARYLQDMMTETASFTPQKDLDTHPPLKRRTKEEGEISLETVDRMSYDELYNMVRALDDPYPNAFIIANGKKITIQGVSASEGAQGGVILNDNAGQFSEEAPAPLFLRLADGYALIKEYKVI